MKQQYQIVKKKVLTPEISQISVHAPLVAAKAKAGQFIILRVDEDGERIPLTIADFDRAAGSVTIIFQKVGFTTELLDSLEEGDDILDFVGPLGRPTEGLRHRPAGGQGPARGRQSGGPDRRL